MNRLIISLIVTVFICSCSDTKGHSDTDEEINALQTEIDSLKKLNTALPNAKNAQIATFLTFQNNDAEDAMNFYVGLFENSRILNVERYGKDGPAIEGSIMVATFELNGSKFACSDSYMKHEWNFTPGVSIWVECKTDAEIENLFTKLSENGKVLMPLNNYGFSTKFTFIEDRFGVSWQLNFE